MKPKCVSNVVKHQYLPWWIQIYCNGIFSPQTLELLLTQGRLPRYSLWFWGPIVARLSTQAHRCPTVSMHQDISKRRADAAHLPHLICGEVMWRSSNKAAGVCCTLYSSLQSAGFPIKLDWKRHRGTEVEYVSGNHKSLAKASPECV